MKNPKVILFAGPIGSSKSPIANYLSWNLGLPIFCKDIIRTEVREDVGVFDVEEFEKRSSKRLESIKEVRKSIILDSSIDRKGSETFSQEENYDFFLISIDISKAFLKKISDYKGYLYKVEGFDKNFNDHQEFLKEYSDRVNLSINDSNFKNRLELSLSEVSKWLSGV